MDPVLPGLRTMRCWGWRNQLLLPVSAPTATVLMLHRAPGTYAIAPRDTVAIPTSMADAQVGAPLSSLHSRTPSVHKYMTRLTFFSKTALILHLIRKFYLNM